VMLRPWRTRRSAPSSLLHLPALPPGEGGRTEREGPGRRHTLSPGAGSKSLVERHFRCSWRAEEGEGSPGTFPIEPVSLRGGAAVEWRRGGGGGPGPAPDASELMDEFEL
jgi:hypothetical protein